ncbi:MAG TPA: OB-fold domain-containing protein, partial [Burkholderiaceae bacterium]|nr:OB-fold domain-containing protein [Burkholderiaceae bacterium]
MTPPVLKPRRKNPVLRTRQPNLPPAARSRVALGLTAAAAMGRFELQQCADCGAVSYPPREACSRCAGARLRWCAQGGDGELLAGTTLHHSNDLFFRERLPWRLGLVRLDAGPTLMVHLTGAGAEVDDGASARVRVTARLDRAGQAVLIALPEKDSTDMTDHPMLREMSSDPRLRKVLVTDGMTAVGQALV